MSIVLSSLKRLPRNHFQMLLKGNEAASRLRYWEVDFRICKVLIAVQFWYELRVKESHCTNAQVISSSYFINLKYILKAHKNKYTAI